MRVGCTAAGRKVVHKEGSSLRASEARDHRRAAVRSEMSRAEDPGGEGVPASMRNCERDLGRSAELDKGIGGGRRHVQESGVEAAEGVLGEIDREAYTGEAPRR
jgi:hypothetical protein